MAIPLGPKKIVSFEELLTPREALTRLLVEKGIFTQEEVWAMVRVGK